VHHVRALAICLPSPPKSGTDLRCSRLRGLVSGTRRVWWGGLCIPSACDEARAVAWLKLRNQPPSWDPILTLGLIDVLWPARLANSDRFHRVGTLSLSANLMAHPAERDPSSYSLALKESQSTEHGYSDETNIVWSPDGKVLGVAHQLVAMIQ